MQGGGGGVDQSQRLGRKPIICNSFAENCMKMKHESIPVGYIPPAG